MSLPIFKTDNKDIMLMQTAWATQINPTLINPATNPVLLKNVSLVIGSNSVPHLLGKKLQGWSIVRQRSAANVYDNQDANTLPGLVLLLVSDANVIVDLLVF